MEAASQNLALVATSAGSTRRVDSKPVWALTAQRTCDRTKI